MEIVAEDHKTGERYVHFTEDEWAVLNLALHKGFMNDVEVSLAQNFGDEAEQLFMNMLRIFEDGLDPDRYIRYLASRKLNKWKPRDTD